MLSDEDIERYKKTHDGFLLKDPDEELIAMYEIDILTSLLNIKAEKYDSREHQDELKKIQLSNLKNGDKIPRNIQNPNFTAIFSTFKKVRDAHEKIEKAHKDGKNDQIEGLQKTLTDSSKNLTKLIANLSSNTDEINNYIPKKLDWIPDIRVIDKIELYLDYIYNIYVLYE
jgi:hypothetical protein